MINQTSNKFDIKEGRVSFEVKRDEVNLRDNEPSTLVKLTQNGNLVSLEKTDKDTVRFSYLDIETGKATLEVGITDLPPERNHAFILIWSAHNKVIKLYINGVLKDTAEITPLE